MQFKRAPHALFRDTAGRPHASPTGWCCGSSPSEGISLQFGAKVPGPRVQLGTVKMDFSYADYFGQPPSTGYETLLYDCMIGDATLFQRADMVETGWDIVKPLQCAWEQATAAPVELYPAGSWGPEGADALLRRDGRVWREPVGVRPDDVRPRPAAAPPPPPKSSGSEQQRTHATHWRRWGPYLSERAWGTVREDYSRDGTAWEYFPHDHARSRAYRWNEDGLGGICDRHQRICFALALWNERDPILKERLFGLTGNEGNHGEDVKE